LVKTLKIHNFANNAPIVTGFVLNDVEYEYLHFFFCIKVEFMKNKKVRGDRRQPSYLGGSRLAAAQTTPAASGDLKFSKSSRNLKSNAI